MPVIPLLLFVSLDRRRLATADLLTVGFSAVGQPLTLDGEWFGDEPYTDTSGGKRGKMPRDSSLCLLSCCYFVCVVSTGQQDIDAMIQWFDIGQRQFSCSVCSCRRSIHRCVLVPLSQLEREELSIETGNGKQESIMENSKQSTYT